MSRSTKLIFITLAVLVLLFSGYLFLAPQPAATYKGGNALTPATRRSSTGPTGALGQGEGAWVKQFDEHTGQLASQFRGAQYDRQPDNTVRVVRPEAEFFLSDGQVLHIEGETGVVAVPESLKPGKDQVFSGPSRPPTRGDLKSVHIQLFKDGTSTTPTLTCVMDNATFDNETFRIFTQDAVIDGKTVPADQIPVTLRGVDYDFDGRGLTIRLNQRDRRLEYLEVTHGNRLVIKNPSKLNDQIPSGPSAVTLPPPLDLPLASPLPYMLADAGSRSALPPLPTRQATSKQAKKGAPPPTTHESGPAIYRASFQDNVRVTQADQDLATGDELRIDFLFDDSSRTATTQKPKQPKATSGAAGAAANPPPASASAAQAATIAPEAVAQNAQVATPATAPATRAAQPPVTIYWTGKLVMSPVTGKAPAADVPTAKNSIVHITGSPLNVRQGSATIVGSALTYRTGTQHLSLRGTEQYPLALTDGKGAVVHGTSIDYLQQERLATLDGPGSATKVLPAQNPGDAEKQLSSAWSRSATLFFTGQPNEPLRIETAKLAGAVSVKHPQMNLKAETLKLDFDPTPTTRPTTVAVATTPKDKNAPPDFTASDLRHLDAQGGVRATVISANDRPQTIVADHLSLDTASTADGRIYPKTLIADGSVVASDPDQELRAGHVKTTLLPGVSQAKAATRGSKGDPEAVPVELEHLTATDNVSIKTADGVTVSATRLDVEVDPQTRAQQVRLLGQPAHVSSKENSVTGPYIEILPADQAYHVRGPGKMHLLQRETPEAKPRPVDVAWTESVEVDGKKNLIDVRGGVSVASTDETGTGERLVITLADNPQAAPKASTPKAATTKRAPITGIASTGDPMQNKTVQTVTFEKGASLESVQADKGTNDLLRQMNLMADVVSYDLPHKRVTVPVPGRMLFVNRQQQQGGKEAGGNNMAGSRGNTAFSWAQQMVFDQSANVMVMTGDVAIVHEAEGSDKPFRLDADKVTATLAPKEGAQQPNAANQATPDSVDLKHVTAEGTIRFTSKDTQLTASTVDYDPATGILIARGMGRDPVHLYDADGAQAGTADEVYFNTKTGQSLKMVNVQAQTRRRK